MPKKLRPFRLVAYFDVDERGNTKLIGFNETSDRGFNKKLRNHIRNAIKHGYRAEKAPHSAEALKAVIRGHSYAIVPISWLLC